MLILYIISIHLPKTGLKCKPPTQSQKHNSIHPNKSQDCRKPYRIIRISSFHPSSTPILLFFPSSILPLFHPSLLPFFHPSVLPSFHSSILPLFHPSLFHNFTPSVINFICRKSTIIVSFKYAYNLKGTASYTHFLSTEIY